METTTQNPIEARLKKQNKKRLLWILLLIAINTLLYAAIIKEQTISERIANALFANLVAYNLFGLLFGTMAALFPYQNLPYRKKYWRASLLTILVIQATVSGGLIVIAVMKSIGWY